MRKISDAEITNELKRVYAINNKIPKSSEWDQLSIFSLDVLLRAFQSYKNAWISAGFEYDLGSNFRKKEEIIIALKNAFIQDRSLGVEELIRASGHTIPTIMKYFGSTYNALCAAKIEINKRIPDEDFISEYKRVYVELGRIPTAKDLDNHSKYAKSTYLRRFESLDKLANLAGLEIDTKIKETNEELLTELKRVCDELGRAPMVSEMENMSKYSHNIYARAFGSFLNALNKVGFNSNGNTKYQQTCSICGIQTTNMISHTSYNHPEEYKEQEQKVLELFKSGLSCRKISVIDGLIFNGPSSINRVIKKHLSKEQIEELRRYKIRNKLKADYASGKYNWINNLNRKRNMADEAKTKNSNGLKNAYANGTRSVWNKGQTKQTNATIAEAAEKISERMKYKFTSGELDKKIGPETSSWNDNRDEVANRYRLGLGFSSEQRRLIKQRAQYKCEKCGVSQEELEENNQTLECDHIIAIICGELNDWETNGQALCPSCHSNKTHKDLKIY